MRELTAKQEMFAREYLVDLNATAAARRAGYSDGSYGRQLLTKPHVEAAIREQKDNRAQRTEITADRVLEELGRIGFAQIGTAFGWDEESVAFVPSEDLTPDEMAAVRSVRAETTHFRREDGTHETQIKLRLEMHDKIAALREIGKHLGIADRLELSGQVKTSGVLVVPAERDGSWGAAARAQQADLDKLATEASAKEATNGRGRLSGNGAGA